MSLEKEPASVEVPSERVVPPAVSTKSAESEEERFGFGFGITLEQSVIIRGNVAGGSIGGVGSVVHVRVVVGGVGHGPVVIAVEEGRVGFGFGLTLEEVVVEGVVVG